MTSPPNSRSSQRDSLYTAGSVFLVSATGKVLKLPIPSESPLDPLTWNISKRLLAFTALELYASIAHFQVIIAGILLKPVQFEFGSGPSGPVEVDSLSAAMNLVTGLGFLVAVPLCTAVGRRPVIIGAASLTCISTLWAGLCGSFQQLLAAVCFQSLATGASITLTTLILIDGTFIHDRPTVLSLHWAIDGVLIKLGLVLLPFFLDLSTTWRPIYLTSFVISVVSLGLVLVLVPETLFLRPPVALDGRVLIQTGAEKVLVYEEAEYAGPSDNQDPFRSRADSLSQSSLNKGPKRDWKALGATYMQILFCLFNPLSFWVALLGAVNLSGVILLSLTQLTTLAEKWGKEPDEISTLLGTAGILGSILALPATGPLISWFTRHHALRRDGVRHAEVYLFPFSIPVISGFLSILLNGLAIQLSWAPGFLYLACGLSTFSYITSNVVFTLWITEAFPQWAAAALATQYAIGNLVSFGISSGIMTWINARSVIAPTVLLCSLTLVLGGLVIPAVFWGKSVRQYIHGRWNTSERGALRPQ